VNTGSFKAPRHGAGGIRLRERTLVRGPKRPYSLRMRREDAIAFLRGLLPAMRRDFGVSRIALFGSTARGEADDDSDLDILVEFGSGPTFLSFMGLKAFLEDRLGRKVDLVTPDALKPRMRPVVEREAVDVAQG